VAFATASVILSGIYRPAAVAGYVILILPWLVEMTGRRLPLRMFATVAACGATILISSGGQWHPLVVLTLMIGQVSALGRLADVVVALAVCGGGLIAAALIGTHPGVMVGSAVAMMFAALTGALLNAQRRALIAMYEAERNRGLDAVHVARQQVAREIHDVVAHSLSVSMLHLGAARRAAEGGDDVTDELKQAEELLRRSLGEARLMAKLLRGPDDTKIAIGAPQASDVTALVEQCRSAGMDVQLVTEGDLTEVREQVGIALYRIIQESLSNVVRHSRDSTVTVSIRRTDHEIRAEVRSSGRRSSGSQGKGLKSRQGIGIAIMSDRARLVGGSLRAGPLEGGWLVECALPLDHQEAP
jgi:signal transduction histidine kinase